MNDDTRSSVGRPRLYESAAEKVDAFRSRQKAMGYLRREVLVTRETTEQVAALASQHGVAAIDVNSALLEYGLQCYQAQAEDPAPLVSAMRASLMHSAEPSMSVGAVHSSAGNTPENPITAFFQKRKGAPE